jgi:MFS family permease|tara:strand:- start:944 stop:2290 length:1347 start_codon:yes stop_codon:yes gene_type:complete
MDQVKVADQLKASPRAMGLLLFLTVLNILNMVDRTLIASFGPQIIADLNLTDSQFGALTGFIFVFFYAIMGLFMGALADRLHRPRLIAAGLLLWSVLTAVSGATKTFLQIGLARLFIGVGESTMTPSSMSMISDLFPQRQRGTAAGLYYLGVPLGAGGAFIVAGVLGPMIGWRNCFYLLGGIGIVLACVLYRVKDPLRGAMEPAVDENASKVKEPSGWRETLPEVLAVIKANPALAWTMLGAIFLHIPLGAGNFVMVWMERERGFELAEIQSLYGLIYIIFGTAGTFLGGFLSDWYQSRWKGGRIRFLAILMLLVAPLTLAFRFASPDSPMFFIALAFALFSVSSFYGPAFSTVQDLTPVRLRGLMTALLLVACNLVGMGLGALMTGLISDLLTAAQVFEPLTKALLVGDGFGFFAAPSFIMASIYLERNRRAAATAAATAIKGAAVA